MTVTRARARTFVLATLATVALLLSGCVYLRLLELKHQLAAFDRNFAVETDDGLRIICRHPVLRTSDIRWLGLPPESIRRVGSAERWRIRWAKVRPAGGHEARRHDIIIHLLFSDGRLTRVSIPQTYFALVPKSFLLDLLRSLGGAQVNRTGRTVEARLPAAQPDLPVIERLLGRPTSRTTAPGEDVYHYRFVPVSTERTRHFVFNLAIHFDAKTGQLLRWEGTTPVGRIGFDFQRGATPARR